MQRSVAVSAALFSQLLDYDPLLNPITGSAVSDLFENESQPLARELCQLLQTSLKTFAGKIAVLMRHDEFEIEIGILRHSETQVVNDARHGSREKIDDAQQSTEKLGKLEQTRPGHVGQRLGGAVIVQAFEAVVIGKRDEGAARMGDRNKG